MYSPFPQRWRWSRALSLRLHIPTSSQSPVDNDWGEKPCRKQLSRTIDPDLVCSEVNFYCFNLFCCAVGLSFSLFCSISFRIPNTIGFEERRGASPISQLAKLRSLFFDREISKLKLNSPAKNTGVEPIPFSMGIFLTQGLNLDPTALQVDSLPSETPSKVSNTLIEDKPGRFGIV